MLDHPSLVDHSDTKRGLNFDSDAEDDHVNDEGDDTCTVMQDDPTFKKVKPKSENDGKKKRKKKLVQEGNKKKKKQ